MAKDNSAAEKRNRARENARQIAAAQAKKEKTAKIILYSGIGVVVVAVAVIVTLLVVQSARPANPPANYVAGGVSLAKGGTVVQPMNMPEGEESSLPTPAEAGVKENAATVTVFIDFQCPACRAFEETNASTLNKLVEEGTIVLEYKPIAILDRFSNGNEYSTRAANLAACVVDSQPEKAGALFEALFAQQPEEGTSGRTDEELLKVASDAGVDTSKALNSDPEQTVESCVTDQSFKKYVTNSTQEALDSGVDATPWVLINGKQTEQTGDPQSLAIEILKATGEVQN
ncbi:MULTISPECIES: DsbA family protein [Brevibacterium]|uniref:Disulfide bond formation protein DsbA n=3 Tax=Bacteria TaxID=2 RepID=A0A165EGQ6_9MICO|nr:thioredoxin domain-containing protein [Brevibacterium casei]NJE66034.1 disulfide bond formation protein DsbA [Brevibacterium sp. LS14]KZE23380.1 disulfide bond formation protein DsbA [Brevibacterium casei]MBE4694562.1 thioredoxin domain-containing protein [Brevibacterium casei]MBY3577684.1 thioredoxin domain-containing protein [Brevibacterium casei]MCT1446346.1 DsbA family protein [Brevibacterium casei]